MNKKRKIKFIDLFAGLGGIRLGFEQACKEKGIETECVLTSEIKPYAIETLKYNHEHKNFVGDIFEVKNEDIPEFDFLFGGFPCQPFSTGGKRQGFADTRGTLFFEIERILRDKKPQGFILENVEGLVKHDIEKKGDKIGRTLTTILYKLENELGYTFKKIYTRGMSEEEAARESVNAVERILEAMEVPRHLSPFGVVEDDFEIIIQESLPSGSLKHNPRPLGSEDIRRILLEAL